MFGTGGTIAMHEEIKEGRKVLVPGISAEQLLSRSGGGINERFAVATLDFPTTMDSSEMEIDYNAELVIAMSYIWKNASEELKQRFIGFVIAHGTDTMAASSAYLSMMLGPNCPFSVGTVGAQQPAEKRHTDVFGNIRLIFDSLEDLNDAHIRERFVTMGGTAGGSYPAVAVEKISDTLVAAFGTFTHPLVINAADFAAEGVKSSFAEEYRDKASFLFVPDLSGKVKQWNDRVFYPIILRGYNHLVPLMPQEGDDPKQIYNQIHAAKAARFIDITTFGGFTVNSKMRGAIMLAAQETGKSVIAANPFPQGKLDHAYEPAVKLREAGVLVTGIPPTALRAKVLLAQRLFGEDQARILDFIGNRNFVGEQPPQYWDQYIKERDAAFAKRTNTINQPRSIEAFLRTGPGIPDGVVKILHSGKISPSA
ncbi:asparaginase [Candidatus Microgenomates bacterium]|nr:asparaginase [Candidatus Microgenomates bacterium]